MVIDETIDTRSLSTRAELARARRRTDSLFSLVSRETLYERPIPARHRLIFYVGHLEAFDWNQLVRGVLRKPSFNPTFDSLFEAGIDPPPGQAPQDSPADWPKLDLVLAYVARTRAAIDQLWDEAPADMQQVVLEHRWMHAETICYLLGQLDALLKSPPARAAEPAAAAPDGHFVAIP